MTFSIRRARPRAALAALCLGAVMVSPVLTGCGGSAKTSTPGGYTPAMQAAQAAANKVAVDLTTFDYRTIEAHYTELKAEGTAAFGQALDANRADTVAYDQKAQVVSAGTVVASAAQPAAADGSVTVLLFVDQRLNAVDAKVGQLVQARIAMVMLNVNGKWVADRATVTGGQ